MHLHFFHPAAPERVGILSEANGRGNQYLDRFVCVAMGIRESVGNLVGRIGDLFGRAGDSAPERDLSGLAEKLNKRRGENVTVVDSGDNLPPNREGIENLAAAARDARYVDRSNEDKAISNLRSYRKLKK